jgi:hypothetical protein
MYADGRDPLDDLISAMNGFFNGSGGKVTYGGAQAGTGVGGVGGAGVITFHRDGSVSSSNGTRTFTLEDGSLVTTTVVDGNRTQVVTSPSGTTTRTSENGGVIERVAVESDGTIIRTVVREDGTGYQRTIKLNGDVTTLTRRGDGSWTKEMLDINGNGVTVIMRPGLPDEVIVKQPDGRIEHTFDGVTITHEPSYWLAGAVAENGATIGTGQNLEIARIIHVDRNSRPRDENDGIITIRTSAVAKDGSHLVIITKVDVTGINQTKEIIHVAKSHDQEGNEQFIYTYTSSEGDKFQIVDSYDGYTATRFAPDGTIIDTTSGSYREGNNIFGLDPKPDDYINTGHHDEDGELEYRGWHPREVILEFLINTSDVRPSLPAPVEWTTERGEQVLRPVSA